MRSKASGKEYQGLGLLILTSFSNEAASLELPLRFLSLQVFGFDSVCHEDAESPFADMVSLFFQILSALEGVLGGFQARNEAQDSKLEKWT